MKPFALGLLVAASFSLPAWAAEPDGPANLITKTESIRIGVQGLLAGKSANTEAQKLQKNALLEYYSMPDQRLLWVDEKGLNERAKLVVAEIAKADNYGLRASDYALPESEGFNASDPKATDWLAESEVKVS